ncbi:hypothetical protein [Streptomyces sp. NPDC047981]|uniref:hypothetical protein n=1 Tax=Streptomyces sp. NPDC047981 TaxID=3154610 RepID=UPI00341ED847
MHTFTVDYSKDRPDPRTWVNRGYFAHSLPRLIPLCQLFGHKPVVDGYDSNYGTRDRARWVACDRCGVRPEPQGVLDADTWQLGQPYTGPFNPGQPMSPTVRKQLAARGHDAGIRQPGAWPARPEGAIGCQLVIGRSPTLGFGFKVGNAGSEHVLSAHIGLGPLGALYVHTECFGTFLQRRLNPTGFHSRVVDLSFHHGRVWWSLWARRNEHRAKDPRWMSGNANINPAHYLLGPRTNTVLDRTEKTPATVHLLDGTQHAVTVRMEKWQQCRPRGRRKTFWAVDWDCPTGIPIRNHAWKGYETYGGHFPAPDGLTDADGWAEEAARLVAESCMRSRDRYGYRAPAA